MLPKINMRQLAAFRAVMMTGSTARAAPLVGSSQPAVSRLILELEKHSGVPLFDRRQGRLHPTPEATRLFHEVERAFASLEHIGSFLDGTSKSLGSHLRVLSMLPTAYSLVPRALKVFQDEAPDTFVTIRTVLRRDTREWLDTQQFDVAFASYPVDFPSASTEPLASAPGVCIMPSGHELGKKKVVHARDVAKHPFVATASEAQARFLVDRVFAEEGLRRQIKVEAQSSSLVCQVVAAGLGVSVVDPFIAEAFEGTGLDIRPFKPEVIFEFRVLYPTGRPRTPLAERFAETVIAQARRSVARAA